MKKVGRPKGSKKDGLKHLSEDQLDKFFSVVRQRKRLRDDLIFSLTFYFGLRVSELCNLKVEDIDSDNFGLIVRGVKSGRTRHYNDMDSKLWHKLQRWLKERRRKCHDAEKSPYLFPHRLLYDQPMTTQNVKSLFKYYAKRAGLNASFSVHSLRHTCGIQRALAGESPIQIQKWLRHRDISSTQVYFEEVEFKDQDQESKEILGKFL